MLLQFIDDCRYSFMHSFLKVPPKHFIEVEVLTLILAIFSHSAGVFGIIVLLHVPLWAKLL